MTSLHKVMAGVIENSKTGRSTCKICRSKIPKDTPRFGRETEFTKDGKVYPTMAWHHFECAIEKYPTLVVSAKLMIELPEDLANLMEKVKKEKFSSAFDLKGISGFPVAGRRVNLKTGVLRVMRVKEMDHFDGSKRIGRSLYIKDGENSSRLYLWDDHASLPVEKGDTIVLLGGITHEAANENIQFHTLEGSKVLLNPTEDEINQYSVSISIFEATSWNRPSGKTAQFEYAKSNRAECKICGEKIMKDSLKVVKPVWHMNEAVNRYFPSADSFHVMCGQKDEHGTDLMHEVVSRLTPELVEKERERLKSLRNVLPENDARKILDQLLD